MMGKRKSKDRDPRRAITIDDLDLVADARRKVLAVHVHVEHLMDMIGPTRLDERLAVLLYTVEASVEEAWETMQRVKSAFE